VTEPNALRGKTILRVFGIIWILQVCVGVLYSYLDSLPAQYPSFVRWIGIENMLEPVYNLFPSIPFFLTLLISAVILVAGGVMILVGSSKRRASGFPRVFGVVVAVLLFIEAVLRNLYMLQYNYPIANTLPETIISLILSLLCPVLFIVGGVMNGRLARPQVAPLIRQEASIQ
jgi:hypothetical protein